MNDQSNNITLQTAAITDRGLSEKRPVNEDSFLSDAGRRIFAVADGVGGAESGEVASRTAVEVLDEAFRHQEDNVDIEDLMEVAIQRANSSIFRMSREQSKLSMMATTFVALHLDGHRATIGHVGDSRLYRLTPDGELRRETHDHSIVEEEVRAGRLTPEQALTHPSRNVISRALGAEDGVEVDMKTIEIEDGTTFLLCSDGITRHLPDEELRDLLSSPLGPEDICQEMKRRCYQRGAEDNLTAVIVRVGEIPHNFYSTIFNDKSNQMRETAQFADTASEMETPPPASAAVAPEPTPTGLLTPPSRMAFPDASAVEQSAPIDAIEEDVEPLILPPSPAPAVQTKPPTSALGKLVRILAILILVVGVGALAFAAGIWFQRRDKTSSSDADVSRGPTQTENVNTSSASNLEERRRQVDRDAQAMKTTLENENGGNPLLSDNPETVYLYGRALLFTGNYEKAREAFNRTLELTKDRDSYYPLIVETKLTAAIIALKRQNLPEIESTANDLRSVVPDEVKQPGTVPNNASSTSSSSTAANPADAQKSDAAEGGTNSNTSTPHPVTHGSP